MACPQEKAAAPERGKSTSLSGQERTASSVQHYDDAVPLRTTHFPILAPPPMSHDGSPMEMPGSDSPRTGGGAVRTFKYGVRSSIDDKQ